MTAKSAHDPVAKYRLRYFFDFGMGGQCLWSASEAARERFGYPVELEELPLSPATVAEAVRIGDWYWSSLNADYPPDPGPWRQAECDQFNRDTAALLVVVRGELGPEFDVVDEQRPMTEDPELDAYLADPKGFRRK